MSVADAKPLRDVPAVVTGGSRGIGAAVAKRLASLGAPTGVIYRSAIAEAEAVVAEIGASGGTAIPIRADVNSERDVDDAFARVEDAFGRPAGVLINNAGVHRGGRLEQLSPDDWDAVIGPSLRGAFLCCRRAAPGMIRYRWGRIVQMSSVIGVKGFPGDSIYATAKAGILGMTRALALELAKSGVTVNAVVPGFVDTDMTRGLNPAVLGKVVDRIPAGRQADPAEIADAVEFLTVGPSYVNGTRLVVDGAWLLA